MAEFEQKKDKCLNVFSFFFAHIKSRAALCISRSGLISELFHFSSEPQECLRNVIKKQKADLKTKKASEKSSSFEFPTKHLTLGSFDLTVSHIKRQDGVRLDRDRMITNIGTFRIVLGLNDEGNVKIGGKESELHKKQPTKRN